MTAMTDPADPTHGPHAHDLPHMLHGMTLISQGLLLANAAVLSDIRRHCVRVDLPAAPYSGEWFDTRPMLDPREHRPQNVDMATTALQWANDTGLVHRHPLHAHLVCVPHCAPKPLDTHHG